MFFLQIHMYYSINHISSRLRRSLTAKRKFQHRKDPFKTIIIIMSRMPLSIVLGLNESGVGYFGTVWSSTSLVATGELTVSNGREAFRYSQHSSLAQTQILLQWLKVSKSMLHRIDRWLYMDWYCAIYLNAMH